MAKEKITLLKKKISKKIVKKVKKGKEDKPKKVVEKQKDKK